MGRPLMPHQREILDVGLEVQSEAAGDPEPGMWAYDDITGSMQRRGGKTAIASPLVSHRLGSGPRRRAFITAQKRKAAVRRWRDITDDLLSQPDLAPLVRRKVSIASEELRWSSTQSTLEPFSPDDEEMHGETPCLLLVDELWSFAHSQAQGIIGGILPAMGTENGQLWKFSTAGTADSWWLNTSQAAGRRAVAAGVRLGRAYFEHGLPDLVEVPGVGELVPVGALTDEQLVDACLRYHPARGYTLRERMVRAAWDEMDHDRAEFLRAFGNRKHEGSESDWQTISADDWTKTTDIVVIPVDAPVALGVAVDANRRQSAVVAVWRAPAGRLAGEVVKVAPGVGWVAGFVAGVAARQQLVGVGVRSSGSSREVLDALTVAEVRGLVPVGPSDYQAAVSAHRTAIESRTWLHRGEPDLTAAAQGVLLAPQAGGKVWAPPVDGSPIAALEAFTLAGWADSHRPEVDRPPFWMG